MTFVLGTLKIKLSSETHIMQLLIVVTTGKMSDVLHSTNPKSDAVNTGSSTACNQRMLYRKCLCLRGKLWPTVQSAKYAYFWTVVVWLQTYMHTHTLFGKQFQETWQGYKFANWEISWTWWLAYQLIKSIISVPLSIISNNSLLPKDWKSTGVTPIYKKVHTILFLTIDQSA